MHLLYLKLESNKVVALIYDSVMGVVRTPKPDCRIPTPCAWYLPTYYVLPNIKLAKGISNFLLDTRLIPLTLHSLIFLNSDILPLTTLGIESPDPMVNPALDHNQKTPKSLSLAKQGVSVRCPLTTPSSFPGRGTEIQKYEVPKYRNIDIQK